MSRPDPEEHRAAQREGWEAAAEGWRRHADRIRDWGMPVSAAMVDALALQPGQRVLELAAGPGDTGFLAAELVVPGGTLISSDGTPAMLAVARHRAEAEGVRNVEFRELELEWIDLETASVDAVLCRWALMLVADPETAAQEIRRVLKPGSRAAFAVWDLAEHNPWASIPDQVMVARGHSEAPDPESPGMFSLGPEGRLQDLLESVGFTDVVVRAQEIGQRYPSADEFLAIVLDLSRMFRQAYNEQPADEQQAIAAAIAERVEPFVTADGSLALPGSSLVAVATA